MTPIHVVILKPNQGELGAIKSLNDSTMRKLLLCFDVGRLTDKIRERKFIKRSKTPVIAYLNYITNNIAEALQFRPDTQVMIDGFQWPADSLAENGDHVVAYMTSRLRSFGVAVIPVIGYDRWGHSDYRAGLKNIQPESNGEVCLRLDSSAFEDLAEPGHFRSIIAEMIDELQLFPYACSILFDFGDISGNSKSVEVVLREAASAIRLLRPKGFNRFVLAGCSLPRTIDLAVPEQDSTGVIWRKEILVWQALRTEFRNVDIMSGDYGVRGPTTSEAPSKYTNGKIRHTINKQIFVVRGHPFSYDGGYTQMHGLSDIVVRSPHFLGESFSWGDRQIARCRSRLTPGGSTRWISIDTCHHLTFVVQEVEEFERNLVLVEAR